MGIYYGDKVRGVKLMSFDSGEILYQKKYDQEMTIEQKNEFVEIYKEMKNESYKIKKEHDILVSLYVECTTTYDYPPRTNWSWMATHLLEMREYGFDVDVPPYFMV